jgi:hypothetical protein
LVWFHRSKLNGVGHETCILCLNSQKQIEWCWTWDGHTWSDFTEANWILLDMRHTYLVWIHRSKLNGVGHEIYIFGLISQKQIEWCWTWNIHIWSYFTEANWMVLDMRRAYLVWIHRSKLNGVLHETGILGLISQKQIEWCWTWDGHTRSEVLWLHIMFWSSSGHFRRSIDTQFWAMCVTGARHLACQQISLPHRLKCVLVQPTLLMESHEPLNCREYSHLLSGIIYFARVARLRLPTLQSFIPTSFYWGFKSFSC